MAFLQYIPHQSLNVVFVRLFQNDIYAAFKTPSNIKSPPKTLTKFYKPTDKPQFTV